MVSTLFGVIGIGICFNASVVMAHAPPPETVRKIEEDLKKFPNNTQLIIERALSRMRSQDPLGCINDLDGISELDAPIQRWKVRGLCNEMLGEYSNAEMDFFQYIKHYPNDPVALAALGRIYNAQTQWSVARAFFHKAARAGNDPELYRLASVAARKVSRKGLANQILAEGYAKTGATSLAIILREHGVRPPSVIRKQQPNTTSAPIETGTVKLHRKPYLQMITQNSVFIVWRTTLPSHGTVRYGKSPDNLDKRVDSQSFSAQHEVELKGLDPQTKYYYRVDSKNQVLAGGIAHYFKTAPLISDSGTTRLWVVGDSGTGGKRQKEVRDSMLKYTHLQPPHLFLHVGDMAYGRGTDKEFTRNFFKIYEDILINTTVWPAMGNHEGITSNAILQKGPYYEGYVLPDAGQAGGLPSGTEAYYSYDYANIHFIVLDSYQHSRKPNGAMLTWLKADLAETDQEWIIAYWHHPPYTKGSHDSDVEYYHIQIRENAIPILEKGGVDLVLGGHSHIYERSYLLDGAYQTPSTKAGILDPRKGLLQEDGPYTKRHYTPNDGALYIVAGHGGTGVSGPGNHPLMAVTEKKNGSVLIDVKDNTMTITNLRYDGKVTDKTGIIKGEGLFMTHPTGDETFIPGQVINLTWATNGTISEVDLEWSCDGGENWQPITKSIPNMGIYKWHIPYIESSNLFFRVTSSIPPHQFDTTAVRSKINSDNMTLNKCNRNDEGGLSWTDNAQAYIWDTGNPNVDEGNTAALTGCHSMTPMVKQPWFMLFGVMVFLKRRQGLKPDGLKPLNRDTGA